MLTSITYPLIKQSKRSFPDPAAPRVIITPLSLMPCLPLLIPSPIPGLTSRLSPKWNAKPSPLFYIEGFSLAPALVFKLPSHFSQLKAQEDFTATDVSLLRGSFSRLDFLSEFIFWGLRWPNIRTFLPDAESALLMTDPGQYRSLHPGCKERKQKSYFNMSSLRMVSLWDPCTLFSFCLSALLSDL